MDTKDLAIKLVMERIGGKGLPVDELGFAFINVYDELNALLTNPSTMEQVLPSLHGLGTPSEPKAQLPDVSVDTQIEAPKVLLASFLDLRGVESIQDEYVVCLECGQKFKHMQRRHFFTQHQMTIEQYKKKHGIPISTSLMCHNSMKRHKEIGRQINGDGHMFKREERRATPAVEVVNPEPQPKVETPGFSAARARLEQLQNRFARKNADAVETAPF